MRRSLSNEPTATSPDLLAEADEVAVEFGARRRRWRRHWPLAAAGGLALVAAGVGVAHALTPPSVEVVVRH